MVSHSYERLNTGQKLFYDSTESVVSLFTEDHGKGLDQIKGTTWSATVFDFKLSDPLAVASQSAASWSLYWPFVFSALIPILASLLLGRFFCGWICPAALIFELNDNVAAWLHRKGLRFKSKHSAVINVNTKYVILFLGLVLCAISGVAFLAAIYPPAIVGREIYYAISVGGFSVGIFFFTGALVFDLLFERRGFCRYLCPGGALYSLLGRYRALRIHRNVQLCNDCEMCNAICQYELQPMQDEFGQECNNCGDCLSICHSQALNYGLRFHDVSYQGQGQFKAYMIPTPVNSSNQVLSSD